MKIGVRQEDTKLEEKPEDLQLSETSKIQEKTVSSCVESAPSVNLSQSGMETEETQGK